MLHKEMMEFDTASDASSEEKEVKDSADDESESESEALGNTGWADAMSKVLNSTTKGSNFILSKAKKDSDIKSKKEKEIEIVDESGQPVQLKSDKNETKTYSEVRKRLDKQKKKAEWEAMCRTKPSVIKKDRERELAKIATRGIVHLFNAVEKHQKVSKVASKEKKEKLNAVKGNFMDILKEYSKKDKVEDCPIVKKAKEEETWSILKDDFMMGAEMKDWDKESEGET